MNIQNKEAVTQNEQQIKSSDEIIDEIIKLFADNIMSILDANYILDETSKRLFNQPVTVICDDVKRIYSMRNKGLIKY